MPTNEITSFQGRYRFLSNFYPTDVLFEGVLYPTSEHDYQAAKTLDQTLRLYISHVRTPGIAKTIGRVHKLRLDWEAIKLDVMYQIVRQKFQSNYVLLKHLLNTKDAYLLEGNYWHDNFWGKCSCKKCHQIEGQNNLGKILMRVRSELREPN